MFDLLRYVEFTFSHASPSLYDIKITPLTILKEPEQQARSKASHITSHVPLTG
jgi:hypothetical protein